MKLMIDVGRNVGRNNTKRSRSAPLQEIGLILSRRKWQILITFLLVFIGVAVATFLTPKQYETRMKILVKNERANMVISSGSNAQTSPPSEVSEAEINTEIELLNNNDLLQQVVAISGLDKIEATGGNSLENRRQIALEAAVNRLQHSLKILPVRKANIIEVDYTAEDPHQAVAVLRQLAVSYLEAHLRVHGSPGTHDFFVGQAAHYQKELKDTEAKLTDFRQKKDIVLFPQQKEEILRRASESNAMLLAAETSIREYKRKIADAQVQLASAERRVTTQNRTLSNQTSVENLATMLVELQNRRTQLLAKFRSDDRLVQEVSQEISDTQNALERAQQRIGSDQTTDVNPVRQALELELAKEQTELAGLEARHQTLLTQTNGYRSQLHNLGYSSTDYDDLMRVQKEQEDNYLLYARKAEEARIADSLDKQKIANVAIAENPVEPHFPSKPNVRVNLLLGAFLAGFLSLGVAFSAEYLQQPFPAGETDPQISANSATNFHTPLLETLESPSDLETLTGLPVLAVTRRS